MNDDGWQPTPAIFESHAAGRWPTNVVLDGSQADALDEQVGVLTSGTVRPHTGNSGRKGGIMGEKVSRERTFSQGDSGGPSRFFPTFRYQAKAPTKERPKVNGTAHPTVKPLELMRWLVRLVTPPNGIVLDPFLGSGTTAEACLLEGFRCLGVERDESYIELIHARMMKHE
jgi:site-specific DNA-methyltransferase (adenine-specific)